MPPWGGRMRSKLVSFLWGGYRQGQKTADWTEEAETCLFFPPFDPIFPPFQPDRPRHAPTARSADRAVPVRLTGFLTVIRVPFGSPPTNLTASVRDTLHISGSDFQLSNEESRMMP